MFKNVQVLDDGDDRDDTSFVDTNLSDLNTSSNLILISGATIGVFAVVTSAIIFYRIKTS